MAAYSISFATANRRPYEKRNAVVGVLAPNTGQVVEIRVVSGGGGLTKAEIEQALQKLIDFMRESQAPQY